MSKDDNSLKDSVPSVGPDFNVEEVDVSILILANAKNRFESVSTFLARRGWPTVLASQFQKAVKHISSEKPDFVLVSIDYNHPSIFKLAALFRQLFNCEVIFFSETMSSSSLAKLGKAGGEKLLGSLSGPNLQRAIRRIIQDKLNPNGCDVRLGNEKEGQASSVDDSPVTIKGDVIDGGSYYMEQLEPVRKKTKFRDLLPPVVRTERTNDDLMASLNILINEENVTGQRMEKEEEKNLYNTVLETIDQLCGPVFINANEMSFDDQIYIIPVRSSVLSGFLFIKTDRANKVDRLSLMELLSKNIPNQIFELSDIKLEKGIEVMATSEIFHHWSDEKALFKVSSRYKDLNFSISFIRTSQEPPVIEPMSNGKMLKVKIEDLDTAHSLTFKGYIYLEKNDRFFLYVRNGRRLLPEQKKRLEDANIKTICVKSIEETNLRKFLYSTHLKTIFEKEDVRPTIEVG